MAEGLPEVQRTLALIKPDAVRAGKAEEIKQLIEIHGFTIVAQQKLQVGAPSMELREAAASFIITNIELCV